jgi:hypothetical protein
LQVVEAGASSSSSEVVMEGVPRRLFEGLLDIRALESTVIFSLELEGGTLRFFEGLLGSRALETTVIFSLELEGEPLRPFEDLEERVLDITTSSTISSSLPLPDTSSSSPLTAECHLAFSADGDLAITRNIFIKYME